MKTVITWVGNRALDGFSGLLLVLVWCLRVWDFLIFSLLIFCLVFHLGVTGRPLRYAAIS